MDIYDVFFRFKGERDYVHGTDMYQKITEAIQKHAGGVMGIGAENLKLTIHDRVRQQCKLVIGKQAMGMQRPDNPKVEFRYSKKTVELIGWFIETADSIEERYGYNEKAITDQCRITQKTVSVRSQTANSAIEVIVAMNKLLHMSLFPEVHGHWFFTRLELKKTIDNVSGMNIKLKLLKNLRNHLTKTLIRIEEQNIGHIYFSLVKL